jgi:hypothetical protein
LLDILDFAFEARHSWTNLILIVISIPR